MFSKLRLVEALDLRQGTLTLRSRQRMSIGHSTEVKVQLPPGTGKVMTLPIVIESESVISDTNFIYQARLTTNVASQLEFRGSDPALRKSVRTHVNIRARARELPDYQATVTEFSAQGAQLKLAGPVQEGSKFMLTFDLDGFRLNTFTVMVEVVHAQDDLCGLRFIPKDAQEQKLLKELDAFLQKRSNADLEQLLSDSFLLDSRDVISPTTDKSIPTVSVSTSTSTSKVVSDIAQLELPVKAQIDAYTHNMVSGSVFMRFVTEDEVIHTLEFPNCRCLKDYESARCRDIARLRSGPITDQSLGPGLWRQYALLAQDGQIILELTSRPCKV